MKTPQIICPSCRGAWEAGTRFCGRCGKSLHQAPPDAGTDENEEGTAPDPWIGRVIDSRYRVLSRIGQGGMGTVYAVEHQRMGKIAAMKVLRRDLAGDRQVLRRFRREVEAVSRLNHPNTVQTFDFGTTESSLYLVMEYVRGEDISALLKRNGPLPFLRTAPMVAQICGALSEAHEMGIVHRDLKPENILIARTKDGRDHVKVVDFGLAKLSERDDDVEVTGRGTILGTPYYMSPEQIRGDKLDQRSDIYSLGAVMYRMITDEPPFTGQTPIGVLTKHLTEPLVLPSQRRPDLPIDGRVDGILARAMAKELPERYETADQFREDLERLRWELEIAQSGTGPVVVAAGSHPGAGSSRGGCAPSQSPSSFSPARSDWQTSPRRDPDGASVSAPYYSAGSPHLGSLHPSTTSGSEASAPGTTQESLLSVSAGDPTVPKMCREDFDAFERSLRRRSLLFGIVVPVLLLGLAGGGLAYVRWLRMQPQEVEKEPNNDLGSATLISAGMPVRGKIGKRLGPSTSDRDYFRIVAGAGASPRLLRVKASPIKNIDITIVVFNSAGIILASADNAGLGEGESIPNLGVKSETVFVAIQESRHSLQARGPTENVTDEYQFVATVSEPSPDEEVEPNDLATDATPISAESPRRGYLGRHHDLDLYRFCGRTGPYQIAFSAPSTIPTRIRVGGGDALKTQSDPMVVATLHEGTIIAIERADPEPKQGERPTASLVDQEYKLLIRPATPTAVLPTP
ncbi:MAG: serine/threonine-protein kinase [Pseudomonadota bacterium]